MTTVYWLEQSEADVPAEDYWLNASEAVRLNGMRFAKRRTEWRLGRWTAKRALAAYLNAPGDTQALSAIEICPAQSGAPEAFFANQPAAATISISHRAGIALCAVAQPGTVVGCDLETIEPRSDQFLADYFTAEEQALVTGAPAADRSWLMAMLWSGKESALKALRVGLRLDTRCVTVRLIDALRPIEDRHLNPGPSHCPDVWRPLLVRCSSRMVFHGWWHYTSNLMRTLVAAPPPVSPLRFILV
jgi:4'-phosphopantetheinyl transferase